MNIFNKMKGSIFLITLIILAGVSQTTNAAKEINTQRIEKMKTNEANIRALLKKYESALNDSDVDKVMELYAKDGIFMPSNNPTATGFAQVTQAYQHVFTNLDLDVTFHIDEIVMCDDLAFVRTVSDGKIKLLKKEVSINNNSRELFLLKRVDQEWKIYRYMFNETGA